MSSKRNLLILALILPFMAVMAQVSFFSDTDLIWREGNPNSYGLAFRTGIHARIDAESYVEAHNYLDWWDFRKEKQRNKFYNRFRIGYAYQDHRTGYGISYDRYKFRGNDEIFINFDPNASPMLRYKVQGLHQLNLDASYLQEPAEIKSALIMRLLHADPVQLFGDPVDGLDDQLFDAYTNVGVTLRPLPGFSTRLALDYKHHHPDADIVGQRDPGSLAGEMGAAYSTGLVPGLHLSASGTYRYQSWEGIPDELKNQVISELRLQAMISPQLSGFLTLINRLSFDDPAEEIYLLANYARAQLQYSFYSAPGSLGSIRAGIKLHPGNSLAFHPSSRAYFAQVEHPVIGDLSAMAAFNLAPEIQNSFRCRLSYRIDRDSEIHLDYLGTQSRREFAADKDYHSGLAIGSELRF